MKKLKKMTFANIDKMLEANQIQALPELQSIVGGGSGTSSDPFTMGEFEEMSFANTWAGGYVTGIGYIGVGDTMIYGFCNDRANHQNVYDSLDEYTATYNYPYGNFFSWVTETMAGYIIGCVSGYLAVAFSALTYLATEGLDTARAELESYLANSGYSNKQFTIAFTTGYNGCTLSAYDTETSTLIHSVTW